MLTGKNIINLIKPNNLSFNKIPLAGQEKLFLISLYHLGH
jgi:hypothetical protein